MIKLARTAIATFMFALPASFTAAQCVSDSILTQLTVNEQAMLSMRVENALYNGNRAWEVSKNGKTSTLFGTLHTADPNIEIPSEIANRVKRADRLFTEITLEDEASLQQDMQGDPSLFMDSNGASIQADLSDTEWASLIEIMAPFGIPAQALDQMRPWFLGTMVALPFCEIALQASGEATLDARIQNLAIQAGVPVSGLETPREALAALEQLSRADALNWLRIGITTAGDLLPVYQAMTDLYVAGRIVEIWELSDIVGQRYFEADELAPLLEMMDTRLITQRNQNWMAYILPALEAGNAVIAVGALHLPRENGLLNMLVAQGYTVSAIPLN